MFIYGTIRLKMMYGLQVDIVINSVHTLIRRSLRGSYFCFTTISVVAVDLVYC